MKCPNYQDYPYRHQNKDCYDYGGGWKTRTQSVFRDLGFRIDCVEDLIGTTGVNTETTTPDGEATTGTTDLQTATMENDGSFYSQN